MAHVSENGEVETVESIYPRVRRVPLVRYVREHPGLIDWYVSAPSAWYTGGDKPRFFDRNAAAEAMLGLVGRRYGVGNLLRVGLRHLPLCGLLAPVPGDFAHEAPGSPFCSEAVAWAIWRGGVDPVPGLVDRLTEPGDLARSLFFEKKGTLVP
jgi:hypothetical protein